MATNPDTEQISRSYVDNAAVKEFVINSLVPKYFSDIDPSLRSVGMIGMTSELISNISEDSFNATSVLFRETFPNRAEIPESIYSHAAIFQLNDMMATAGSCTFILVLEEAEIIKYMEMDKDSGIYYFTLDKDTTIYVEDVPYTLDYDIKIRCVKKYEDGIEDYIFTAMYDFGSYTNSLSNITDPYVRVRRTLNGYLSLEARLHQVTRVYEYSNIITNSVINLPIVDVEFSGKLAGFDVLYKLPGDADYSIQLEKRMVYSQPTTSPFCYYQIYDENYLRLTFNANDLYFVPNFNSELKIILYITDGESANFEIYDGNNVITSASDTNQNYDSQILVSAKPMTGSVGGRDSLLLTALQDMTVEQYRTAMALTTEPDLQYFFANYKWYYDDFYIKFIKRRNDVYERIFGAYIVMKNADYIYKTNTLGIRMNLSDMTHPEKNTWMIEPGTLFCYENEDDTLLHYYRDPFYNEIYYAEYETALENGEIDYIPDTYDKSDIPAYLDRPASFAEFKQRNGYVDSRTVFDLAYDDNGELNLDELRALDDPHNKKFLYINPFLIRFKKDPNLISMYMTYVNTESILDFTSQNDDSYVQFIIYKAMMTRKFEKAKRYTLTVYVSPSVAINDSLHPYIALKENYVEQEGDNYDDRYILKQRTMVHKNDLRVMAVFYDGEHPAAYVELVPQYFLNGNSVIVYQAEITTNDHITSDGHIRILSEPALYSAYDPDGINYYYKPHADDDTLYDQYDENGIIHVKNISINELTPRIMNGELKEYREAVSMIGGDIIQVPMEDVTCKIHTLYGRIFDSLEHDLRPCTSAETNNLFVEYDSTYDKYIWTNEYASKSTPLRFVKPLLNVRGHLYFEDFKEVNQDGTFKWDINDIRIEHIPFVRWRLPFEYEYDENGDLVYDNLDFFMKKFEANYNQVTDIIYERLRNETTIDLKFYNTYGKSENYFIGDDDEQLDMINLRIAFDIWFVSGTDLLYAVPEVKRFIKEQIESVNPDGFNQLHISNLMRKIEYNFSYVDHIRFMGINDYDTTYQSIKLRYQNLDDMTKEERRMYVPELLVIDLEDILIREYIAE